MDKQQEQHHLPTVTDAKQLSEPLTKFVSKANSEITAVVIIVIANLIFIYKMAELYTFSTKDPFMLAGFFVASQAMIVSVCSRLFQRELVGFFERLKIELLRRVQPTRPPK